VSAESTAGDQDAATGSGGAPSEEELRAAYEAELSRITSAEMMLQAAVSLLNVGALRLGMAGASPGAETSAGAAGQRDLEQVRDAIDGVRALLGVLERRAPAQLGPLRDALSQLQIAYAREAQASTRRGGDETAGDEPAAAEAATTGAGGQAGGAARERPSDAQDARRRPGPAEASGRLWTPGR